MAGERDNIKLRFDRPEEASFYHSPSIEHSRQRSNVCFNVCLGVWGTHKELANRKVVKSDTDLSFPLPLTHTISNSCMCSKGTIYYFKKLLTVA